MTPINLPRHNTDEGIFSGFYKVSLITSVVSAETSAMFYSFMI